MLTCKGWDRWPSTDTDWDLPKCEFMLIGTFHSLAKMPDICVHIDIEPLNQVTVAKYLGMFID